MYKRIKIALFFLLFLGFLAVGSLFVFSGKIALLNPQGMIAEKQRDLLLFSTYLMLIVVIPVFILTFFIAWKYRADNKKAKYDPEWDYNFAAEATWWGIPFILMLILGIVNWKGCYDLDPFKPIDSNVKRLKIQVVALQWKWLFIYPEQQIATINFIQFPVATPIDFEITADAPMNSFWIPQLGGQVYAMPRMRSKLHLIAHTLDSYRGSSAHLSGKGFSGMTFVAKSSTYDDFEKWIESVKDSSEPLTADNYNRLAEPSQYAPQAFFKLSEQGLFDQIIMKYKTPPKKEG